jgi:hypothetical protein
MGRYVQLGAVRTWYEEDGGGPPLVLLHTEEPTLTVADLAGYPGPTLVMVGDDDEIPMDHTLALRQGLPRSQLAVVPGCGHGRFVDKPELCNRIVTGFLTEDG